MTHLKIEDYKNELHSLINKYVNAFENNELIKPKDDINQVDNLTTVCERCNTNKGPKTANKFGHPTVKKVNPPNINKAESFSDELTAIINKYSKETDSNTPDFILADYMLNCLNAYNRAIKLRISWYNPKIN